MSIMEQQSSILSEQELHLLASDSMGEATEAVRIYSYKYKAKFDNNPFYFANSIEQLMFMLSTSPRGVVLILPASIESEPVAELDKLLSLLVHRSDIMVFWLGQLPSMETNLSVFLHCPNEHKIHENIRIWENRINNLFKDWLAQYSVAFITENDIQKETHQANFDAIGLLNISYFDAITSLTEIDKQKLLIIDLEVAGLHLINILNDLTNKECFPIVIIYGRLAPNVCHATYTLIENNSFPVLASFTETPDKAQWERLFLSLFSRVYLKLWVNEEKPEVGIYNIYNLETNSITSYFCSYGMSKKQITDLPKKTGISRIIEYESLIDWYPDGIRREVHESLADEINSDVSHVDVCIKHPEKILSTSVTFSALVIARLAQTKIYWAVENEKNLLTDILKSFPISHLILSESLSLQLLSDVPEALLTFIKQAQLQQINIIASLPPSKRTREALAIYGIESVLTK